MVKSAARVTDLLELVSREPAGLAFTAIARETKIPKSSLHGLVAVLTARGYLVRDGAAYRIGLRLFELGSRYLKHTELIAAAAPVMEVLNRCCGETVNLGTRDGRQIVILHQVSSRHAYGLSVSVGSRWPAHSSVIGKALLATLPDAEVRALYAGAALEACTRYTATTVDELLARLAETRRQGVALNRQEMFEGGESVGAVARDHAGRAVAAVSAAVPVFRITKAYRERLVSSLRLTAGAISTKLGYPGGVTDADLDRQLGSLWGVPLAAEASPPTNGRVARVDRPKVKGRKT